MLDMLCIAASTFLVILLPCCSLTFILECHWNVVLLLGRRRDWFQLSAQ